MKKAYVWSGYYIQNGKKDEMTFDTVSVKQRNIAGVGNDSVGRFTLQGNKFGSDCRFKKVYDKHADQFYVLYKGELSEDMQIIEGEWQIHAANGIK